MAPGFKHENESSPITTKPGLKGHRFVLMFLTWFGSNMLLRFRLKSNLTYKKGKLQRRQQVNQNARERESHQITKAVKFDRNYLPHLS